MALAWIVVGRLTLLSKAASSHQLKEALLPEMSEELARNML
jgi:hypothetical protein